MGKLYALVLSLGVFLAVSFGFIIPIGVSSNDDVGVIAAFSYLFVIVPIVCFYFGQKIIVGIKAIKESLTTESGV